MRFFLIGDFLLCLAAPNGYGQQRKEASKKESCCGAIRIDENRTKSLSRGLSGESRFCLFGISRLSSSAAPPVFLKTKSRALITKVEN